MDLVAAGVDWMIHRTLRARFRNVYVLGPTEIPRPAIFVANHHGWHDGYVMYALLKSLGHPVLDWIQEFGAFPLFGAVGGMPFPADDPAGRAKTIRQTIRRMNQENRSLMLFAEGILHRPPELLPFGGALELVAKRVPRATIFPVAITYDMSLHERPEVFLQIGDPVAPDETQSAVQRILNGFNPEDPSWRTLLAGTKDVNERMDMRRIPR